MFTLTLIFSGTNVVFGQYDPALTVAPTGCPTPISVASACGGTASALNPMPGVSYTYEVSVTNGGTAPIIHWFVTDNPSFIADNATTNGGGDLTTDIEVVATSAYILTAGANYNNSTSTTPTIAISWKFFTADVFLVAYVKSDPTCTDNIQVYKIEPVNLFTLDIAALTAAGATNATKSDCVSPIVDAEYLAASNVVSMDYGVNYIYYAVSAANFTHSWQPSFQVSATNMGADGALAVDWAYSNQANGSGAIWHATALTAGEYESTDPVNAVVPANGTVGAAGECIIVRVTVDHNKNETLADIVVSFAVDGVMYNGTDYATADLGDVHHDTGVTDPANCTGIDLYTNDNDTYTLTRRPTVTDQTDPDPDDNFIPKN